MTRRRGIVLCVCLIVTACSAEDARRSEEDSAAPSPASADSIAPVENLPPDAAGARAWLAQSPRHGEWAVIETTGADSTRAWVVYPERSTRAPVVIVVHDSSGLTSWVRAVADQLAAHGFLAIAPDLLTMENVPLDPSGEPVSDSAVAAARVHDVRKQSAMMVAAARWGMREPAALQSYGTVGIGWGGAVAFQHAITSPTVGGTVLYYGTSASTRDLRGINTPVLELHAVADAGFNATTWRLTVQFLRKHLEPGARSITR